MRIKIVHPKDPDYEKELLFRWEMLSKPMGMPPGSQIEPWEEESVHFLALEGREIVGCVLLYPESDEIAFMSQLAVIEESRQKAYSKQIIERMEETVERMGIKQIFLETTSEWIGFFGKLGYQLKGDPVLRSGYHYQCMKKSL